MGQKNDKNRDIAFAAGAISAALGLAAFLATDPVNIPFDDVLTTGALLFIIALLPLMGILADRLNALPVFAAIGLFIPHAVIGITAYGTFDLPPEVLILMVACPLMFGMGYLFALMSKVPPHRKLYRTTLVLFICLVMPSLFYHAPRFLAIKTLLLGSATLGIFCTLVFLTAQWGSLGSSVSPSAINTAIRQKLNIELAFTSSPYVFWAFAFFCFMIHLGLFMWLWGLLFELTIESSLTIMPMLPILCALGVLFTRNMVSTLGVRRSIMIQLLIWMGFLLAFHMEPRPWEQIVLIMACAFSLGIFLAGIWSIFTLALPQRHAGLMYGFLIALIAYTGLGTYVFVEAQISEAHFGFAAIFLVLSAITLQILPLQKVIEPGAASIIALGSDFPIWNDLPQGELSRLRWTTHLIRLLARTSIELFFGKMRVVGQENLQSSHGAIVVANHPNTFLDPMLITALYPSRLHYLAKSTLWRSPFLGSILDRLGAIPVFRRQDHRHVSDSNRDTFAKAVMKLKRSATILIFPEGVSAEGLSLKPVKTGAARLAFQAMETHPECNIPIIPVGIDYDNPSLFRTGVTLRIGEPIEAKKWLEQHKHEPREAVCAVTAEISLRLKALLPHLENPDLENLVHRISDLYGSRIQSIMGVTDPNEARIKISEAVNHYDSTDPDTVNVFHKQLEAFDAQSRRLGTPENHPPIPIRDLFAILGGLFSFSTFGLFINWMPYRLTGIIIDRVALARVWVATAKMMVGAAIFAMYYGVLALILYLLIGATLTYLIMIAVVLSAIIILGSHDRYVFRIKQLKTLWHAFWTQNTDQQLESMRISLIQDLERFRETYANYMASQNQE